MKTTTAAAAAPSTSWTTEKAQMCVPNHSGLVALHVLLFGTGRGCGGPNEIASAAICHTQTAPNRYGSCDVEGSPAGGGTSDHICQCGNVSSTGTDHLLMYMRVGGWKARDRPGLFGCTWQQHGGTQIVRQHSARHSLPLPLFAPPSATSTTSTPCLPFRMHEHARTHARTHAHTIARTRESVPIRRTFFALLSACQRHGHTHVHTRMHAHAHAHAHTRAHGPPRATSARIVLTATFNRRVVLVVSVVTREDTPDLASATITPATHVRMQHAEGAPPPLTSATPAPTSTGEGAVLHEQVITGSPATRTPLAPTCPAQQLRTTKRTCKGYCHGGGVGWADSFAVHLPGHGKVCTTDGFLPAFGRALRSMPHSSVRPLRALAQRVDATIVTTASALAKQPCQWPTCTCAAVRRACACTQCVDSTGYRLFQTRMHALSRATPRHELRA